MRLYNDWRCAAHREEFALNADLGYYPRDYFSKRFEPELKELSL
jgi:hypothetical protein